jgi:hypothetical protein
MVEAAQIGQGVDFRNPTAANSNCLMRAARGADGLPRQELAYRSLNPVGKWKMNRLVTVCVG